MARHRGRWFLRSAPRYTSKFHRFSLSRSQHRQTTHEVVYQAVMRLSLRNEGATDTVKILVPDEYTAMRIAEVLAVKQIYKIGDINLYSQEALGPGQKN